jgi:hypothetical protein
VYPFVAKVPREHKYPAFASRLVGYAVSYPIVQPDNVSWHLVIITYMGAIDFGHQERTHWMPIPQCVGNELFQAEMIP